MHEPGDGLRAMCHILARLGRMLWEGTFGRITAARRAKRLLLRHLSPEQREMFLKKGMFVIEGREFMVDDGWDKMRYLIRRRNARSWPHSHGNVISIRPNGFPYKVHSLHSYHKVPRYDELLAQKLWLESGGRPFCGLPLTSRKPIV